jgi:hypothetical protein
VTLLVRDGSAADMETLRLRASASIGEPVELVPRTALRRTAGTVLLPWIGRPYAIAPVVLAAALRLRLRKARWVDGDGRTGSCHLPFFVREGSRLLWFLALDAVATVLAWLLLVSRPRAKSPPRGANADAGGAPTIVLPVLPDLSHTFVYAEALRVCELDPAARVVCLSRGGGGVPVHPEARAVERHCTFVPREGVTARYLRLHGWMLRAPRRTAALFALYRDRRGGRVGALLGKLPLREPTHPGNAFALASALRRLGARGPLHVYGSTYAANVTMGAALLLDLPFSITSYVDFDFPYDHKMLEEKIAASGFFRVCTHACRERLLAMLPAVARERVPVIEFGLDLDVWRGRRRPRARAARACDRRPRRRRSRRAPRAAELRRGAAAAR